MAILYMNVENIKYLNLYFFLLKVACGYHTCIQGLFNVHFYFGGYQLQL